MAEIIPQTRRLVKSLTLNQLGGIILLNDKWQNMLNASDVIHDLEL
jgi:hypothetical protein